MANVINLAPSFVNLNVTNDVNPMASQKRYNTSITVFEFKTKLELVTGCNHTSMVLEAFDADDKPLCKLTDNTAPLSSYPLENGTRVHVTDPFAKKIDFDATEDLEKFEIPYEEYAKRDDTVLAWKRKMKLGQFKEVDPEEAKAIADAEKKRADDEREKAESMNLGDRCEVTVPKQEVKRGTVKFVGKTHFKPGFWVGIAYDEPVGKNNGSMDGHHYFDCTEKYGGFVKPQHVQVGDYPEFGIDDLDEI